MVLKTWPAAGYNEYEEELYDNGYGDLPSVDDLEVAAAAAAAAMEQISSSQPDTDEEVNTNVAAAHRYLELPSLCPLRQSYNHVTKHTFICGARLQAN